MKQKKYENIGLIMDESSYEYPLWKMCSDADRIEHVNVHKDSGIYEDMSFVPEVILAINADTTPSVECHGVTYTLSEQFRNVCVYEKDDSVLKMRRQK